MAGREAPAALLSVAQIAARARIHRPHQRAGRREDRGAHASAYRDAALCERLAQRLERVPGELGQLVEKKDAVVGEADLSRSEIDAAPHERGPGGRVMRSPERPCRRQFGLSSRATRRRSRYASLPRLREQ